MIRRILGVATLFLGLLTTSLRPSTPAQAAASRPFSVTITHVECVDDCDEAGLEAAGEGHADFYAKVLINGVKQPPGSDEDDPSTPIIDDDGDIEPYWVVSTEVPDTVRTCRSPSRSGTTTAPAATTSATASPEERRQQPRLLGRRTSTASGSTPGPGTGQHQLAAVLLDRRRRR